MEKSKLRFRVQGLGGTVVTARGSSSANACKINFVYLCSCKSYRTDFSCLFFVFLVPIAMF